MAMTLIDWRPSALAAACPPIVPAQARPTAQVSVLGLRPVPTVVRTESGFAGVGRTAAALAGADRLGATKINNYIGTPAVMSDMGLAVAGATTSSVIALAKGLRLNQQHAADKVKGADARGIPPRGRRKV